VTKKADEAKQVVRDAEATAKEAQEASNSMLAASEEKSNVRAILLDEADDKLSGIKIPYKEKTKEPISNFVEQDFGQELRDEALRDEDDVPAGNVESGYVDQRNIKELEGLDNIGAKVLNKEEISKARVIGNTGAEPATNKVVPITEAVRVEGRSKNPDKSMQELTANDPVSQNKQIIEMHKAGKSNMVIARELGLGIGEVKLVIDLSNKHRKVR
jgi:hypothetical protein